jgi:hypothetical protein
MARYLIAMRHRSVLGPFLVVAAFAGCGGGDSDAGAMPPCIVPEDELATIMDREDVFAAPQQDGVSCIYGADGQPLVSLSVRTPEQFQAERDRFEDNGFLLPELVAVDGFEGEANIDPRYNSLNVTSGGRIVSVEIVSAERSDPTAEIDLEREIARAAVERL